MYADGIRHSLELPYTLFEDQRSGETLGKLQKVRTDVERLISTSVNLVFTTLIGLVFVMIYAARVHWSVAPAYLLTVPLLGGLSSVLSRKIKTVQKQIVRRDHGARRRDHRITAQYRAGEEPRAGAAGDRPAQRDHRQDPQPGAQEGALSAEPELHSGHLRELAAHIDSVPDAVPDLYAAHHGGAVLFAVDLLVLHLRSAAGTGQRDQRLPRDGGIAEQFRDDPGPAAGAAAAASRRREPAGAAAVRGRHVPAPVGFRAGAEQHHVRRHARGDHRLRRTFGRGKDHARETAGGAVPSPDGAHLLQRHARRRDRNRRTARAHRLCDAGRAVVFRLHSRESALRQPGGDRSRSAWRCCNRLRSKGC